MDCPEVQSIVAGERETDLTDAESLELESHLGSCGPCREALTRAEDDLGRLAALAEPPQVPEKAWVRVDEAVRAQARRKPGAEDPFAEPRRVPAEPRLALERARPGRGGIVVAFVVAAGVLVFALAALDMAPAPERGGAIGRVAPPDKDGDDVTVVQHQPGPRYQATFLDLRGPHELPALKRR